MFSGIIQETGILFSRTSKLSNLFCNFKAKKVLHTLKIGDSIAVNGVCLTVVEFDTESFTVEIVPETRRVTTLDALTMGTIVNLENALSLGGSISGHLVLGHVETTSQVLRLQPEGNALNVQFELRDEFATSIIKKGQVAIDGMSLTIMNVDKNSFWVTLTSYTQQITNACHYTVGTPVNIETDILAKYVDKALARTLDQRLRSNNA